jgi:protoheme IX farnesyltransferase
VSNPEVRISGRPGRPESWQEQLSVYVQLTKPRIIELLLITTVPAMIAAAQGWPGWWLVTTTLIGGTLSAAGANTINSVVDRDIDRIMRRTRSRPLPAGRADPGPALVFGAGLGGAGFLWLWITTNLLAASLSTAGLLFYVFVYTLFLKRTSPQNIVVGGAAGAMPALVGWAAVTGSLAAPAWVMFAIVFLWTPPHFWALSLRYEDDYRAAGVPMLPVVVGVRPTLDHIFWYTVALVGGSLLLYPTGAVGAVYLAAALGLGGWIIIAALRLQRRPAAAMRFFGWTNVYLAVLFIAIAVDVLID